MKFTKGEWMMKEGVCAYNGCQVRQVKVEKDQKSVYFYVLPTMKDERAVGGVMLEIVVSSPVEDAIRVCAYHFRGIKDNEPKFDLNDSRLPLTVITNQERTQIISGKTTLTVEHLPCKMEYSYDGKKLTSIANRFGETELGYVTTPSGAYMRVKFDMAIGEKIYGLGERFTPLVRNGQTVDIWNEDGGTSTELSYKNIPFYLSNQNYGVFVNDTGKVSYEICSESVNKCQASVPGEKIDFTVFGSSDRKGVLKRYTDMTGKPALPPLWSFGLWLTSSFTTRYDEETVMRFIDGMTERKIPISVFHIDCFWMKENEWCGFEWDENLFPNPKEFLAKIKQKGIRVCLWINPYIGQKSPAFTEAMEKGYLLKRPNGDVWQWDLWQSGQGIVDFTNPQARLWYQGKLRQLLETGVDVFKTDFGERIPTDCVYFDGSDPEKMHNYYTYLYNQAVFEVLSENRPKDACVFARSATVGGQKFPVHWGGDSFSNYASMYESLRGGLSLGMSGFGYWSHDIGGFEGTAPDHLFKRWLAFGLLSSHSRLHGSTSYRVPWLFGEEAVDVCRFFNDLKKSLLPYLFASAVQTHQTGIPMMRATMLESDEIGAQDCDRQYFLGENLLVAPVFSEDGTADVYLPRGTWTSYLTGKAVNGNGWQTEQHDFFSLPLYVKENSIIPVKESDYEQIDRDLLLKIYEVKTQAKQTLVNQDGEKIGAVTVQKEGEKTIVFIEGQVKGLKLLFVNKTVKNVTGATVEDGVIIPFANTVEVTFADDKEIR